MFTLPSDVASLQYFNCTVCLMVVLALIPFLLNANSRRPAGKSGILHTVTLAIDLFLRIKKCLQIARSTSLAMNRFAQVLLVIVACCPCLNANENFTGGPYSLGLRRVASKDSGMAFFTFNGDKKDYCIYGSYSLDASKKPTIFNFYPKDAFEKTEVDSTSFWTFSPDFTQHYCTGTVRFEWVQGDGKVVLTHIPSSTSINFESLKIGGGAIVELTSTKDEPFADKNQPPYYCSLKEYTNRYNQDPDSVWGLKLLVDTNTMFSSAAGDVMGWGAMQLTAKKDNPWQGDAWLFHYCKGEILAGRGTFHASFSKLEPQAILLELNMPRVFKKADGTGVASWVVHQSEESGMVLKVPLSDRGILAQPIAYATEFFHVSEAGKRQRKFYNGGILNLEKIEQQKYASLNFQWNTTVKFASLPRLKDMDLENVRPLYEAIVLSPPPGYSQTLLDAAHLRKPPPDPLVALKGKPASDYRRYLEKDPDNIRVLVKYIELLGDKDYENLRWGLAALGKLRPYSHKVHYNHALCAQQVGRKREAIEALQRAANIAVGDEQAQYCKYLSELYVAQKKYKNAFDALDMCAKAQPNDREVQLQMVNLLALYGDKQWSSETINEFLMFAKREKDRAKYWEYHKSIAAMFAKLGDFEKALSISTKMIEERHEVRTAKLYRDLFLARKDLSQGEGFQFWDELNGEFEVVGKVVEYKFETLKLQKLDGGFVTLVVSKLSDASRKQLPNTVSAAKPIVDAGR